MAMTKEEHEQYCCANENMNNISEISNINNDLTNEMSSEQVTTEEVSEDMVHNTNDDNKEDINVIKSIIQEVKENLCDKSKTKIGNICKAGTKAILSTKRVSPNSRIIMDYRTIISNNLTLEQLATHKHGTVIAIHFSDFEKIKNNSNRNELEQYIYDNIGSDNTVSCILYLTNEPGSPSDNEARNLLPKFKAYIELKNLKPIRRVDKLDNNDPKKKPIPRGETNKYNDKWCGHYFYEISGGKQESELSHTKEDEIFTQSKGFISSPIVEHYVILSLVYQLLFAEDIHDYIKDENTIITLKERCEKILKSKKFSGDTCYNLIQKLNNIKKDTEDNDKYKLISLITFEPIKMKNLNIMEICHLESASKDKYYFCEDNNVILSDYRPGNLFWDTKESNMRMGEDSPNEYWVKVNNAKERGNKYI